MVSISPKNNSSTNDFGSPRGDLESKPWHQEIRITRAPILEIPILLFYRSNPTYDRILPLVEKELAASGFKISLVSMPARFLAEEADAFINSHRSKISGSICITDNTMRRISPTHFVTDGDPASQTLDSILYGATLEAVSDKETGGVFALHSLLSRHTNPNDFLSFQQEVLGLVSKILSRALKNKPVDYVVIFESHLSEHAPFSRAPRYQNHGSVVAQLFYDLGFSPKDVQVCRNIRNLNLARLEACNFCVALGDRHFVTTGALDQHAISLAASHIALARSVVRGSLDALCDDVKMVSAGASLIKERLGLQPSPVPDEKISGRRVFLQLPIESLWDDVFRQGLVAPGEFEDTDVLVRKVSEMIISEVLRRAATVN